MLLGLGDFFMIEKIHDDDKPGYLMDLCLSWIEKNEVSCPEQIYQVDIMTIKSMELVEEICNLIGYYKDEDDDF